MAATSQNKDKFEDYDGFVEKFKPKKTTDDCYTPQNVYDCILQWVRERIERRGLAGSKGVPGKRRKALWL